MSVSAASTKAKPSVFNPDAIDLDGLLRRLHLPTIRRLYPELEERAAGEGMSHRDYLAMLVAEEVAHRAETRIKRATRKAYFPFLRTIEEFDFKLQTSVRQSLLGSYLGPELVTEGRCLILCGRSGRGCLDGWPFWPLRPSEAWPRRCCSLGGVLWKRSASKSISSPCSWS